MVTRSKKTSEKEEKKVRVKVGNLKLNKETVKDLTSDNLRGIKGGRADDKTAEVGCSAYDCTIKDDD